MGQIGITTREQIYSTFWNLVSAITIPNTFPGVSSTSPFVTKSRLLQHWSKVPAEQQPALFMSQVDEGPTASNQTLSGMPYKWSLRVKLWLYSQRGADDTAIPAISMNPLMDAVMNAIRNPEIGERQSLNRLVYSVRLFGRIVTDEGMLGSQAVSVVPVELFTAEL